MERSKFDTKKLITDKTNLVSKHIHCQKELVCLPLTPSPTCPTFMAPMSLPNMEWPFHKPPKMSIGWKVSMFSSLNCPCFTLKIPSLIPSSNPSPSHSIHVRIHLGCLLWIKVGWRERQLKRVDKRRYSLSKVGKNRLKYNFFIPLKFFLSGGVEFEFLFIY